MTLMHSCCCWESVRSGSFASAIFTLSFYTVMLMSCIFHIHNVSDQPALLLASSMMLLLSGAAVASSLTLLIGLWADNHRLLLPWIFIITIASFVDIIVSIYLVVEAQPNDSVNTIFFIVDFIICIINIYGVLCVISQYQEYKQGRGFANQRRAFQQRLAVQNRNLLQVPVMIKITTSDGQPTDYDMGQDQSMIQTLPSPSMLTRSSRISTDFSDVTGEMTDEDIKIVVTSSD